jgi:hypothetical protein
LASTGESTRCQNPEEQHHHPQRRENLKSHTVASKVCMKSKRFMHDSFHRPNTIITSTKDSLLRVVLSVNTKDYLYPSTEQNNFLESQVLKKLPAFYETRRFITVLTRARHWTLS